MLQATRVPIGNTGSNPSYANLSLLADGGGNDDSSTQRNIVANLMNSFGVNHTMGTWAGGHATNSATNPCLEIELPFYSQFRFFPAKYTNREESPEFCNFHKIQMTTTDQYFNDTFTVQDTYKRAGYDSYVAAAEDFSLFFFLGCPRMYYAVFPNY